LRQDDDAAHLAHFDDSPYLSDDFVGRAGERHQIDEAGGYQLAVAVQRSRLG